ncbi:MAG TPA: class I SAM-dependent rRNA methyltransferase [Isosphaeraceae bacterium]|jgi:23S rRNA (cytosine1962-C5)-methyltransferase|nr:class I SAM-dependent rRNA methyltransferase [Isosphaeraceae bacterium]
MNTMRVVIKPKKSRPFFARHPWVFVTSIGRVEGEPAAGDEVDVVSHEGQPIGRGLFNPYSAIRVRLYRWDGGPLDEAFWRARLEAALRLRTDLLGLAGPGQGCRLVFSESDGLSGLTVDRYDRWVVAQFTSLALFTRKEMLIRLLAELTGAEGIMLRTERGMAAQEGLEADDGPVVGSLPPAPVDITEHGLTYLVDIQCGQKTGFYLDQRDNRRAVASYAQGRRVLDLFCYTGGFTLNALHHGRAVSALGIDASSTAIEIARQNAVVNHLSTARFETADVFEVLETLRSKGERFGLVVCDPPKFARHPKAVEDALRGYLRLNRAVLDVLEPDGILATCSCSSHVDRELFAEMLGQVSELSGRPIQILSQRGQATDHPVAASCLETEYLKCFVCRVE